VTIAKDRGRRAPETLRVTAGFYRWEMSREPSQSTQAKAFVERAAARAAGEEVRASVFKLATAHRAAEDVTVSLVVTSLAAPFGDDPRAENPREHSSQAKEHEVTEADRNHLDSEE
jgi:hypothetical protein